MNGECRNQIVEFYSAQRVGGELALLALAFAVVLIAALWRFGRSALP